MNYSGTMRLVIESPADRRWVSRNFAVLKHLYTMGLVITDGNLEITLQGLQPASDPTLEQTAHPLPVAGPPETSAHPAPAQILQE